MAIYAKIKGQKQGAITGAVTANNFTGQIQVDTVNYGVGGTSDANTGMPTGKRVARPLHITKPMDQSSPLLHTSCVTGETLPSVMISYVIEGQGNKAFATVELTNAMIQDFDQQASFDGHSVEKLTFTYQKIEFTWVNGGIVSTNDWMAVT